MSRSGNRVTPASGRADGAPRERPTAWRSGARSGGLSGMRWLARARARTGSGVDADGRWGVARLVAQREAERRVTGPDAVAATGDAAGPESVPPQRTPRPPEPAVPPSPRPPLRTPPVPRPPLPVPRRPFGLVRTGPVVPNASDARAARPRVEPDPALFGFARHTRGRLGARVYALFFVLVFALIIVQTIASIV